MIIIKSQSASGIKPLTPDFTRTLLTFTLLLVVLGCSSKLGASTTNETVSYTDKKAYITKYYSWASLQRTPPRQKDEISKESMRAKESKGDKYYIARFDKNGTLLYLEKRSHHQREYLYKYSYILGKAIKRRVNRIGKFTSAPRISMAIKSRLRANIRH